MPLQKRQKIAVAVTTAMIMPLDSDEEPKEQREWAKFYLQYRDEYSHLNLVRPIDNKDFKIYLILNRQNFEDLLKLISPKIVKKGIKIRRAMHMAALEKLLDVSIGVPSNNMKGTSLLENITSRNEDSEMEEGEIVDDLDDLSDISSEEEYLLRQRLQVLENFNKVLERKKTKRTTLVRGKHREEDSLSHDLSEISATEFDDNFPQINTKGNIVVYRDHRHLKSHHKQKKKKDIDLYKDSGKVKESKKKSHRKKKLGVKVISETSDESEDEYRNKRRRLADAVIVHKDKSDRSTLQARLKKMFETNTLEVKPVSTQDKETETDTNPRLETTSCSPIVLKNSEVGENNEKDVQRENISKYVVIESVDLSTDDDVMIVTSEKSQDIPDGVVKPNVEVKKHSDSDEDLELLRQHALQSKASKQKTEQTNNADSISNDHTIDHSDKPMAIPEDEDSDTAELRVICLKSALLKKAIETKKKMKLKKRLSQSFNLQDELLKDQEELISRIETENNNTDIESVDMDIGSDTEDKVKDYSNDSVSKKNDSNKHGEDKENNERNVVQVNASKEDELEEDEDLLRAQLLTSLSKNLPTLVDPKVLDSIEKVEETKEKPVVSTTKVALPVPGEKRLVINVGESDSEPENEVTKNLTKLHMKLVDSNKLTEPPVKMSDPNDFQKRLDMFLKSTRMKVETTKETDPHKMTEIRNESKKQKEDTTVPKAVSNLPKSAQMEYKRLLKKMEELEKLKQARQQAAVNVLSKVQAKDTLKPRNISSDSAKLAALNQLEEQIALSRKNIAEESAKMLKLKEEATKLSQKYKIVATELRNISTAITLNKKEQKSVQNRLSKIRIQHQKLLNSTTSMHSKTNGPVILPNRMMKTQKENNMHTSMQVLAKNDKVPVNANPRLLAYSSMMDVNSNKKASLQTKDSNTKENSTDHFDIEQKNSNCVSAKVGKDGGDLIERSKRANSTGNIAKGKEKGPYDDYESPLQALCTASWEGDPHGILCPFEVSGCCKDADCKYLHPRPPPQA